MKMGGFQPVTERERKRTVVIAQEKTKAVLSTFFLSFFFLFFSRFFSTFVFLDPIKTQTIDTYFSLTSEKKQVY